MFITKRFLILLTAIVLCLPCFAGLEDTYGHAAWTEGEMNTRIATFGVGNATNSYTDWLTIPANSTFASVQILDSTSATTPFYTNASEAAGIARYAGAITNASYVVEIANLTVAAPTPAISINAIPIYNAVQSASPSVAAAYDTQIQWTSSTYPAIPIISRKGIYNIPLHGALNMRLKFTRGGATTAYQWAIIRFNNR